MADSYPTFRHHLGSDARRIQQTRRRLAEDVFGHALEHPVPVFQFVAHDRANANLFEVR
jgi:hypothetical protein